jgi:hypothetical protein
MLEYSNVYGVRASTVGALNILYINNNNNIY